MDPLKTSAPPEAKLHFLDYWRIIRIRKMVILAVFLLVALTATIFTFIMPETFSSVAKIKVERDVTDVSSVTGSMTTSSAYQYDPYFIQTEFEVIQSEIILDKVVDALNLRKEWAAKLNLSGDLKPSEARTYLKGMLRLRPTRNTSILEIEVFSDNAEEAAKIANQIAEVYRNHRLEERQALISGGFEAFQKKFKSFDEDVKKEEKELDDIRQQLGVTDTDPQSTGPGQTLGPVNVLHYNSQKIEHEAMYIREAKLLEQLKQLRTNDLRQAIPTAAPDGILSQLLQDLISYETKQVALANDYGPDNPEVQRTQKLVDQCNRQIDERVKGIIAGMEVHVASLQAVVDNSVQKVEEAKSNDMRIAEMSRPYFRKKADVERTKRIRDMLATRAEQENIELIIPKTQMVTITEHAEVNNRPVRPKKALNIGLGVIAGLVVGVALAFFIEYLDTSVKTIDDVERTLQSPVLGVIPQNVGYLMEEGVESPHAEAYRVLRTNLLFSRKDDKLNTVAVVSAGAGEGKSTTVFNLATVFAQSGQRVLMVDSDLRRPTLHRLLNVSNSLGLTNYLLKQNTLEEVIQTTGLPNLDFLSSGKLPSSSLGILSSAQMRDLITELKQRYDFVFFDSPPIMGVSDASILASEVDMTLQVIQYRRYPQPMNIRAKQLIEKVGGNLTGIVLNNINMAQDENYYYYSGYYNDEDAKSDDNGAAGANGSAGGHARADIKPKF